MSTEENKALIRRYFAALNGTPKPRTTLERFTTDVELIRHIEQVEAAFPLFRMDLLETIAERDLVSVRGTMRGVHRGEFQGVPATGRELSWAIAMTSRIFDGKIVEHWMLTDTLSMSGSAEAEKLAEPRLHPNLHGLGSAILASLGSRNRALLQSFESAGLTPREQEVAFLLCERLSVGEIAERLFISRKTAAKHLEHIYLKVGLHRRRHVYEQLLGESLRPTFRFQDLRAANAAHQV